jgi:hypothetical protein
MDEKILFIKPKLSNSIIKFIGVVALTIFVFIKLGWILGLIFLIYAIVFLSNLLRLITIEGNQLSSAWWWLPSIKLEKLDINQISSISFKSIQIGVRSYSALPGLIIRTDHKKMSFSISNYLAADIQNLLSRLQKSNSRIQFDGVGQSIITTGTYDLAKQAQMNKDFKFAKFFVVWIIIVTFFSLVLFAYLSSR